MTNSANEEIEFIRSLKWDAPTLPIKSSRAQRHSESFSFARSRWLCGSSAKMIAASNDVWMPDYPFGLNDYVNRNTRDSILAPLVRRSTNQATRRELARRMCLLSMTKKASEVEESSSIDMVALPPTSISCVIRRSEVEPEWLGYRKSEGLVMSVGSEEAMFSEGSINFDRLRRRARLDMCTSRSCRICFLGVMSALAMAYAILAYTDTTGVQL